MKFRDLICKNAFRKNFPEKCPTFTWAEVLNHFRIFMDKSNLLNITNVNIVLSISVLSIVGFQVDLLFLIVIKLFVVYISCKWDLLQILPSHYVSEMQEILPLIYTLKIFKS
jgi:hypothetical protein